MDALKIQQLVDKYLQQSLEGLSMVPWLPMESNVTDEALDAFEEVLKHKLPAAYRLFLKHKHFYELHIDQASFCSHPVNTWQKSLWGMIFDGFPRKDLIDKGYIPFADWSDWGHLCFDTTKHSANNNYPVVLWDHEISDEVEFMAHDFAALLDHLDSEAIKNGADS